MSQCHGMKKSKIIYCYHWRLNGEVKGVTRGGNLKLVSDYPRGWPEQGGNLKLLHRRPQRAALWYKASVDTTLFLPHPRVKVSIVGSLRDREVACSTSDRQGSNFESCVWRTVSCQSSHHPQEVLLAQFSLYVHKGGLKPDSFHFILLPKSNARAYLKQRKNIVALITGNFPWCIHKTTDQAMRLVDIIVPTNQMPKIWVNRLSSCTGCKQINSYCFPTNMEPISDCFPTNLEPMSA